MKTSYDINSLQFSKLSISSPHNSRKEQKNIDQRMPTDATAYRPVLPRLDFPTNQFERYLNMDSKDVKSSSWKSPTKADDKTKGSKYGN